MRHTLRTHKNPKDPINGFVVRSYKQVGLGGGPKVGFVDLGLGVSASVGLAIGGEHLVVRLISEAPTLNPKP